MKNSPIRLRCCASFALLAVAWFAPPASAGPSDPAIEVNPGQRHLFLDDEVIQKTQELTKTMHSPEKRGAVIRPDTPADGCRVQTYSTSPMWVPDEGVYKMVYMAFPMEDHSQIGAALAISKDGIRWEKPNLGQNVKVRGSTDNNRIFVDPALRWGDNALWNVVYDPDDKDPARRYKGLLGAIGRTPVVSADCVHWKRLDVPKIPSSDTSALSFDRERRQFLAFVKSHNEFGRASALSTSSDFLTWTQPKPCFGADKEDQTRAAAVIRSVINDPGLSHPQFIDPDPVTGWKPPENHIPTWRTECYEFNAFPYEGRYVGMAMMYFPTGLDMATKNNTDGFDIIQLATSRDLTNWTRLGDRKPFIGSSRIDKGLVGVFDRGEMTAPGQPLLKGDELWFYYTGFKSRVMLYSMNDDGSKRDQATLTADEKADLADGWSAICLAVLRRDGFISLDAGDAAGEILTKQIRMTGKDFYVNFDAGKNGRLQVEVLDANNKAVPGFTMKDCSGVTGKEARQLVRWNGADVATLGGKAVHLRFRMTSGSFYSFWTE